MDIPDRIESQDPLAIPEYLVFAFEEWFAELIREACEQGKATARAAVTKAVHIQDAFATRSLTPAQLAELAERAAKWMEPRWPSDPADADEVERLLGVSRELLELRERALAAGEDDNISRVVVIEAGLREVLRSQTLAILEFTHDRFDEARELEASELLQWLRGDVAMSIVTGLDSREDMTEADDIAALDEHLRGARLTVHRLWQILHAPDAGGLA